VRKYIAFLPILWALWRDDINAANRLYVAWQERWDADPAVRRVNARRGHLGNLRSRETLPDDGSLPDSAAGPRPD
jgi:hypothetical protein